MQYEKEAVPELTMDTLLKARVNHLLVQNYILRNRRYQSLDKKYCIERSCLDVLSKKLDTLHRKINDFWKHLFSITLNLNARTEAVITAILNSVFAEKAAIDDLFAGTKTFFTDVEEGFKQYQFILYCHFSNSAPPGNMTEAEKMLSYLCSDVIIMNEKVSRIHEKCFYFLCTVERALKKIDVVLKR